MWGIGFDRGLDQVLDEGSPAYLRAPALACRITGCAHFVGSGHHGLHLLQVVDVEGGMP
jgi:hypothetical protein